MRKITGKPIVFLCSALMLLGILAVTIPAFAWFVGPQTEFLPPFDASIVKSYFDADSVIDEQVPENNVFFITKPVHLYNLAYLTDKGVFTGATKFQIGKQRADAAVTGDAAFYVYKDNYSDETADDELTYRSIDMSVYDAERGIPAIGADIKGDGTDAFYHQLEGNGITIANCTVKDNFVRDGSTAYIGNVGLFGVLKDGASVRNLNVSGLTLTTSQSNLSAEINCGLLAGYLDQSDTGKIVFERIGVSESGMATNTKVNSAFSLIGSGTPKGLETANNFFVKDANSGDTGIVNIDHIYDKIRTTTHTVADTSYFQYNDDGTKYLNASGNSVINFKTIAMTDYHVGNIYDQYILRTDGNDYGAYVDDEHFKIPPEADIRVAATDYGVSFAPNEIIGGTSENGLGVFDLVTHSASAANLNHKYNYGRYAIRGMNAADSESFNRFYYSTAEITSKNTNNLFLDADGKTITNGVSDAFLPVNDATVPTSYNAEEQFEKAYFYEASFDSMAEKNYFSDTAYTYLKELFASTLIDQNGKNIAPGTKDFGVAAKMLDENKEVVPVTKMQHFLQMQNYNSSSSTAATISSVDEQGNTTAWVANSIYFTLTREANVTVFASSKDSYGNNLVVGVYEHNNTMASSGVRVMRHPLYAMWVPNANTAFYYFPEGGNDGTAPTTRKGNSLFAHTFKIPKGTYFLSVPDRTVAVMHISVQGQDSGDMGDIGKDGLAVDFITAAEAGQGTFIVGGESYVYSQTAFAIDIQNSVVFEVLFIRIKAAGAAAGESTDIVYAFVADPGYASYLALVNEGLGVITSADPRAGPNSS